MCIIIKIKGNKASLLVGIHPTVRDNQNLNYPSQQGALWYKAWCLASGWNIMLSLQWGFPYRERQFLQRKKTMDLLPVSQLLGSRLQSCSLGMDKSWMLLLINTGIKVYPWQQRRARCLGFVVAENHASYPLSMLNWHNPILVCLRVVVTC